MSKPGLLLWTESAARLLGDSLAGRFDVIQLWQDPEPDATLKARGREVIATLTWNMNASQLEHLPNLRLIVVPGAGYDGVDVAAARARDVKVANAGATHSGIVADHAVALTLASIHRCQNCRTGCAKGAGRSKVSRNPVGTRCRPNGSASSVWATSEPPLRNGSRRSAERLLGGRLE